MVKRLTAASVFVFASLVAATVQAGPTCFTPDEAKAAHFRTMQQEFNVAALNCQSVDPNDPNPSVRDRYNQFVTRFGDAMQSNAQILKAHFSRAGGSFDRWMTQIANDAGQRVMDDPMYCQRTSDNLDKALTLSSPELPGFAAGAMQNVSYVSECSDAPSAASAKGHGKKAAAKHHPAHKAKAEAKDHAKAKSQTETN